MVQFYSPIPKTNRVATCTIDDDVEQSISQYEGHLETECRNVVFVMFQIGESSAAQVKEDVDHSNSEKGRKNIQRREKGIITVNDKFCRSFVHELFFGKNTFLEAVNAVMEVWIVNCGLLIEPAIQELMANLLVMVRFTS